MKPELGRSGRARRRNAPNPLAGYYRLRRGGIRHDRRAGPDHPPRRVPGDSQPVEIVFLPCRILDASAPGSEVSTRGIYCYAASKRGVRPEFCNSTCHETRDHVSTSALRRPTPADPDRPPIDPDRLPAEPDRLPDEPGRIPTGSGRIDAGRPSVDRVGGGDNLVLSLAGESRNPGEGPRKRTPGSPRPAGPAD